MKIENILHMIGSKFKGLFSSMRLDYPTPDEVFKQLNDEFQFTLDPCADIYNAKCRIFFTKEQDGLKQKWIGNVFCNPPYGRELPMWIKKGYDSVKERNCNIAVFLIPSRTDTRWWHDYVMKANEIRYVKGRIKFNGKNSAPFPSAIVIFRSKRDA